MSEKYLGEHSTPLLINQIKSKCTQKTISLPVASYSEFGKIYQYVGVTSGDLVHNYFYECVTDGSDPANYSWSQVNVQPTAPSPTAATTSFDNTASELTATNVQDAIDEVDGAVDTLETTKQDVMQATTLPTASATEFGKIYQYLGADNVVSGLKHGYFYECVYDGVTLEYFWEQTNVQPHVNPTASNISYDNTTSGLTADDVQEAIDEIDGQFNTINDNIVGINEKIPSTASDTNQLVDHNSLGTAAFKDFTPNVAPNNHSLVESNAVYNAITTALTSIYKPRGELTCAELTSSLLIAANVGDIYEMSDAGTTSALFLQGAGETIHIGDNVGIIQTGVDTYKFNLMANAFDLTDYQKKDLTQAVEGATTVEGALGALSTNKQSKTLVTPITVNGVNQTTVEGALGSLNDNSYYNLTSGYDSSSRIIKISGFSPSTSSTTGETYLLRSRGKECIFLTIGQTASDLNLERNYNAFKISGDQSYSKISNLVFDYTNKELYLTVGAYAAVYITQIGGTKNNLSITTENVIVPTDDVIEIPIKDAASLSDLNVKADKVTSATNGDLASLDSNGNLVDSGVSKNTILDSGICAHGNNLNRLESQTIMSYLNGLDSSIKFATFYVLSNATNVTDKIDTTNTYTYSCYRTGANLATWVITAIATVNTSLVYVASFGSGATEITWKKVVTESDITPTQIERYNKGACTVYVYKNSGMFLINLVGDSTSTAFTDGVICTLSNIPNINISIPCYYVEVGVASKNGYLFLAANGDLQLRNASYELVTSNVTYIRGQGWYF